MARRKVYKQFNTGALAPNFDRLEVIYLTSEYSYQRFVSWEKITKLLRSVYDDVSAEFLKGEDVLININDTNLPSNITPYRVLQYRLEASYQGELEVIYKPRRYAINLTREPIWNDALVNKHLLFPEESENK